MLDATLRGIIDNALSYFAVMGEMFTAFDVTRKVRDDNPEIHVFHSDVRDYVHQEFGNGKLILLGYDRVTVPVGDPHPWLYYIPGTHDPNRYVTRLNGAIPLPAPVIKVTIGAVFGGISGQN